MTNAWSLSQVEGPGSGEMDAITCGSMQLTNFITFMAKWERPPSSLELLSVLTHGFNRAVQASGCESLTVLTVFSLPTGKQVIPTKFTLCSGQASEIALSHSKGSPTTLFIFLSTFFQDETIQKKPPKSGALSHIAIIIHWKLIT